MKVVKEEGKKGSMVYMSVDEKDHKETESEAPTREL